MSTLIDSCRCGSAFTVSTHEVKVLRRAHQRWAARHDDFLDLPMTSVSAELELSDQDESSFQRASAAPGSLTG